MKGYMSSLTLPNTEALSPPSFDRRVHGLRQKIRTLGKVFRKRNPTDSELIDIQTIALEKVGNIIEFTLKEQGRKVERVHIDTIVRSEFGTNPIFTNGIREQIDTNTSKNAEKEFVALIEGKRVRNPEVRLWIAGLVHRVIAHHLQLNPSA
jgi:hypothetical protein